MLKVTKNNLTLIIHKHWIDSRGFLTVPAAYAVKLFFGDVTLKKALEESKKKWSYSWTIRKVKDDES